MEEDRIRMLKLLSAAFAFLPLQSQGRESSEVAHVTVYTDATGIRPQNEWQGAELDELYRFILNLGEREGMLWPDTEVDDEGFEIPVDLMEGDEDKLMVPADVWAIESLVSKKVSSSTMENYETCTICLEEFSDGEEVLCKPCSHGFHADGIRKWLTTSHYCPMCRFKMPIDA